MFNIGEKYKRRDIHNLYGGQQQGGISTPSRHPVIFLFTSESGEAYGYRDGWQDDGTFYYTGEGQVGDMAFVRGNRAIRDHEQDGKDLHLFSYVGSGYVQYEGRMVYINHKWGPASDVNGNVRQAIIFVLKPATA